jgi:RNA polymerase sigma factor (sigma-70 family)
MDTFNEAGRMVLDGDALAEARAEWDGGVPSSMLGGGPSSQVDSEGRAPLSQTESERQGVWESVTKAAAQFAVDACALSKGSATPYECYEILVTHMLDRPDIPAASMEALRQEVFFRAHKVEEKKKAKGEPIRNWAALLVTITGYMVCNYLRVHKRRPKPAEGVDVDQLAGSSPDAEEAIEEAQRAVRVRIILSTLPEDERRALWLASSGKFTLLEISQMLGCPLGTLKTKLTAARKRFKKHAKKLFGMVSETGRPNDADG